MVSLDVFSHFLHILPNSSSWIRYSQCFSKMLQFSKVLKHRLARIIHIIEYANYLLERIYILLSTRRITFQGA